VGYGVATQAMGSGESAVIDCDLWDMQNSGNLNTQQSCGG